LVNRWQVLAGSKHMPAVSEREESLGYFRGGHQGRGNIEKAASCGHTRGAAGRLSPPAGGDWDRASGRALLVPSAMAEDDGDQSEGGHCSGEETLGSGEIRVQVHPGRVQADGLGEGQAPQQVPARSVHLPGGGMARGQTSAEGMRPGATQTAAQKVRQDALLAVVADALAEARAGEHHVCEASSSLQ